MILSKNQENTVAKAHIKNFSKDDWDCERTAFEGRVKIALPSKLVALYEEFSCPLNDVTCSYYADCFDLDETSEAGLIASAVCKAITEELLIICDKDRILCAAKEAGIEV